MRKLLTGTTALIGAVALAATASAQTAGPKAPFTAILDGDVNVNFAIMSGTQNTAHNRAYGLESNGWLRFFFEGHADNGLTYGFFVRTLSEASSITANGFSNDREGTYLKGSWGTFEIGSGSSPGKEGYPFVVAQWAGGAGQQRYQGPDGGLEGVFMKDAVPAGFYAALTKFGADYVGAGRPTHMYYTSPEWSGFHFALNFTPDGTSRTEDVFLTTTAGGASSATTSSTTNFQNISEALIEYKGTLGPVALITAFTYAYGESKNTFIGNSSTQSNTNLNNFHTGFRANYAGFELATDYTYAGDSIKPSNRNGIAALANNNFNSTPGDGGPSAWGWSTGLSYYAGPWTVGALYWYARGAGQYNSLAAGATFLGVASPVAQSARGQWEQNLYEFGVSYQLAPGLKLYQTAIIYSDYNTHVTTQTAAASTAGRDARNPTGQIFLTGMAFDW